MKNLISYGERLGWAINQRGTSAAEISKRTKISKSSISQYINGTTGAPRNTTSAKLAKFLNVNQYWLDTGRGDWQATENADGNDQINAIESLLASSSPSVIGLMENLRDMERRNKLSPELVSLLNATVDTFRKIDEVQTTQLDVDNLINMAKERPDG